MFARFHACYWFIYLAIAGFSAVTYSASLPTKPKTIMDYEAAAVQQYLSLMRSLPVIAAKDEAFWQLGMALEILVNHCQKTEASCSDVGKITLEAFRLKTKGPKKWWYDDFGWWGFSFMKLYEATHDTEYLDAAQQCFSAMQPAKRSWSSSTDIKKLSLTPLFEHGCYNTDLPLEAKPFEGIQNTVTNAQYLRLSLSLFEHYYAAYVKAPSEQLGHTAQIYWFEAMEQYQWFLNWFSQGLLNKDFSGAHHMLIEERINKYMSQASEPNYRAKRFWTGDQGLMMDILSQLNAIQQNLKGNNPLNVTTDLLKTDIERIAVGIAKGVKTYLTSDEHRLLTYKTQKEDQFPFGDSTDYACGPGVFFNAMIRASSLDAALAKKFHGDAYQSILKSNADWAKENPVPWTFELMDSFMIGLNKLAALRAAIELYQGN